MDTAPNHAEDHANREDHNPYLPSDVLERTLEWIVFLVEKGSLESEPSPSEEHKSAGNNEQDERSTDTARVRDDSLGVARNENDNYCRNADDHRPHTLHDMALVLSHSIRSIKSC